MPSEPFLSPQQMTEQLSSWLSGCAENTVVQVIGFNHKAFADSLFSCYQIEKPHRYSYWAVKRKAEFLAGRIAADKALKLLGYSDFIVQIGLHRSPVWPAGVSGSISHSDDCAIAIVSAENCLLGVDIEETLLSKESISVFLSEKEQALIRNQGVRNTNKNWLFTAVFSAKESLFKALYPLVKRYIDFDYAELIGIEDQKLRFKLATTETLQQGAVSGRLPAELSVYYRLLEVKKNQYAVITLAKADLEKQAL